VTHPKADYDSTVYRPILRRMGELAFMKSEKESVKGKEMGGLAKTTDGPTVGLIKRTI